MYLDAIFFTFKYHSVKSWNLKYEHKARPYTLDLEVLMKFDKLASEGKQIREWTLLGKTLRVSKNQKNKPKQIFLLKVETHMSSSINPPAR